MRAVIVELRKNRAAALADNGVVYLVDAKGRAVGQQIEIGARRRFKKPLTWAACVAVLGAMATTGVYAAYDPYTVVSVDSETESIEYTLNRFDQVLDVRPANEASEPMAKELRGKVPRFTHFDTAMEHTMDELYDGKPDVENSTLSITVDAKSEKTANRLKEHVGARLGENAPDGRPRPNAHISAHGELPPPPDKPDDAPAPTQSAEADAAETEQA